MIRASSKPHFLLDLYSRLRDVPPLQATSGAYVWRMGWGGQKPDHPTVLEQSGERPPWSPRDWLRELLSSLPFTQNTGLTVLIGNERQA